MKDFYFFLSIFVIIIGLIVLFINFFWMSRKAKVIFSQQKDLQRPSEITIFEQGLKETGEDGERFFDWRDFQEWREDEAYLLVYASELTFLIIPKRMVEDQEEIDQIKLYLKGNGVQ